MSMFHQKKVPAKNALAPSLSVLNSTVSALPTDKAVDPIADAKTAAIKMASKTLLIRQKKKS